MQRVRTAAQNSEAKTKKKKRTKKKTLCFSSAEKQKNLFQALRRGQPDLHRHAECDRLGQRRHPRRSNPTPGARCNACARLHKTPRQKQKKKNEQKKKHSASPRQKNKKICFRLYGAANPSFTGTQSATGLVNGDTLTGVTTGTAVYGSCATCVSNVGSYAINGSGLSATICNYVFTFVQAAGNATA